MAERELSIEAVPWGPTPEQLSELSRGLHDHEAVRRFLGDVQYRLLYMELLERAVKAERRPTPPSRFRATFFDYTNSRTVIAEGSLSNVATLDISESATQPLPSPEEFDRAVETLNAHRDLGGRLRSQHAVAYPAMPPLVDVEAEPPDGRSRRVLAVGLLPARRDVAHEIVGVDLGDQSVMRFDQHAPERAQAHNPICGLPYANQSSTPKGVPGTVTVTVKQGSTVLWTFQLVRPSASSGTRGSGVELRYVNYRGKRLLYRAHVPILNVSYESNACGPYRDWQYAENPFQANGNNVGSGFRLCPTPAQTILDSGVDQGNFQGVAIYVQGQEVVLVSEMEAGWYRYISEWRLHANGTIRPRFGFSATQNSCVCSTHYHHAFWRFDFDIRTASNNIVREFNDPPLVGGSNWHDKRYEIRRPRDPSRKRHWRIENAATHEAYDVLPNAADGVATVSPDWPYPRGDVWILRYRGSELDDGHNSTGTNTEADLDSFVNGESLYQQDVVLWYAAHFRHDAAEEPGEFGHIVGPDLVPSNW